MADDLGLLPDPILQAAQVRSTAMNAAGAKARPADFLPVMPAFEERPGSSDSEAQLARFRAVAARIAPRPPPGG